MTELLEAKDLLYIAFLGIALYLHGSTMWRRGMTEGVQAGVEGTVDQMIADGLVDYDEKTGEIFAKNSK